MISSENDRGIVALLEYWGGSVNLRAYSDINNEEPAAVISFDSAKNEERLKAEVI